MLYELVHRGVVVPDPPEPLGLEIVVRGRKRRLNPKQEEMALAWARKKGTPYVQDPVFVANFMRDLALALGYDEPLTPEEIDLSTCYEQVDRERAAKANLSPEQRRALAQERKQQREALKARYGYAIVNGQRVELGTYLVEPSGIFMGRGQHPLRGRWKEGASRADITLNIGPDQSGLEGEWGGIVWEPESMWVARWKDRLTGRLKYIWLSDTAPVKQAREAGKFDKAAELHRRIGEVRQYIDEALRDRHPRRRMIATVCYLIDALCLRVGDEKDADEADTVGATTLRPEHVILHADGTAEFSFLGKDSVPWHKTIALPEHVLANLRVLWEAAKAASASSAAGTAARELPQIFPDVTSGSVNAFLSHIMPGLSAKVFRTHHATRVVDESLAAARVSRADPEIDKWRAATEANLAAAVLCNHTKQEKEISDEARLRSERRLASAHERLERARGQYEVEDAGVRAVQAQRADAGADRQTTGVAERQQARQQQRLAAAIRRRAHAQAVLERATLALRQVETQQAVNARKRGWNLSTSLKSYIDPRVYYRWGQSVGYDVLDRYYPTTLRRKYAWVREDDALPVASADVAIRTCVAADLVEVADLLRRVGETYPEVALPATQAEVMEAFLPDLEHDWRESLVARDEDGGLLAVVVLGPPRIEGRSTTIDLFAAIDPLASTPELGQALAAEARRRARANVAGKAGGDVLRPSRTDWFVAAADLVAALGLTERDREPA